MLLVKGAHANAYVNRSSGSVRTCSVPQLDRGEESASERASFPALIIIDYGVGVALPRTEVPVKFTDTLLTLCAAVACRPGPCLCHVMRLRVR